MIEVRRTNGENPRYAILEKVESTGPRFTHASIGPEGIVLHGGGVFRPTGDRGDMYIAFFPEVEGLFSLVEGPVELENFKKEFPVAVASEMVFTTEKKLGTDVLFDLLEEAKEFERKASNKIPSAPSVAAPEPTSGEAPPDARQVGGKHYKLQTIQHWTYVMANNIPYMEAQIIKYVSRHAAKNGIQDLEKAKHFLEKLIEFEQLKKAGKGYGSTVVDLAPKLEP